MSSQTADRFGLAIGDQVVVRLTTASGQQNVTDYTVSAIYDDAASGGMTTAFVSFEDLIADLNMKPNEQQQIAIFLRTAPMQNMRQRLLLRRLPKRVIALPLEASRQLSAG